MTTNREKKAVAQPQTAVSEEKYLTAKQAAAYIGASLNYFYKLTSGHRLPMYNPTGRKLLFKQSELQAWIESSRVCSDDELAAQAELKLLKRNGL